MKKLIGTIIFASLFLIVSAQQDQQYTQFMYNKLGLNPGYAGNHEAMCLTGVYRQQWMGLEGAPATQLLSFNMPLSNMRAGLGVNLMRNTIGISTRVGLDASYAYRLRLGQGMLGIGLQGSIRSIRQNYADDRLVATQNILLDGAIPDGEKSKVVPNFGAGLYYQGRNFYVGLSAPRLLNNNIDFNDTGTIIGREVLHMYLMAGVVFDVSESIQLKPQLLLKYAKNSPFDADINLMAIFVKKYSAGLTYRLGGSSVSGGGESIDFLLAAQILDNLLLGVSYDLTLSELKDYNSGGIEVVLRYCLGSSQGDEIINPRFF